MAGDHKFFMTIIQSIYQVHLLDYLSCVKNQKYEKIWKKSNLRGNLKHEQDD